MSIKFRFCPIESAKTVDGKNRINVAFSSETPVLRVGDGIDNPKGEPYYEVIDHSDAANCDLALLNNRGAVLDEHDPKSPIGVVISATVNTSEKVARAELEMDNDGDGLIRSRQMENGTRPHISVGYDQTKLLSVSAHEDGKPIKRFAWRGHEISSVAVPADGVVGVGRTFTAIESELTLDKVKNLTPEQKMRLRTLLAPDTAPGLPPAAPVIDLVAETQKTRTATATEFKTRAKEITAIADAFLETHKGKSMSDGSPLADKIRSVAASALQSDESLEQFKVRCLTDILGATPAKTISMRSIGVSEKDEEQYSIMRGIQGAAKNRSSGKEGLPDSNTLEGEVHNAIVKANSTGFGYDQSGFIVPFDAQLRSSTTPFKTRKQRDMQAEIFAQGGAFVPIQMVTPPIEILRNMEVLSQLGTRHMDGLQGNIVIPRQDAAATAYAVSEIGALTASGQILGQLNLSPKRIGATQAYSKQFVFQSTPDAESFLRDDLFKVIALQRDEYGLNGQGSNSQPLGVMNTPGVNAITFGTTPTWKQIVAMETAILSANVVGPLAYVSTPATRGSLKTVAVALTGATTIGGAQNAVWYNDTVNAYPAIASNQIPNNQVICGMWSDLIEASWNGFDVVVDYVTKAVNAEIVITINIWCDFALRHPQAFTVSNDSGAQ